ncbi:MAG TPA: L,D-transpeptidase [Polyangiaceae bacterium]|nr:L,D-transpeptidase [Polyangiaceae bacterium]
MRARLAWMMSLTLLACRREDAGEETPAAARVALQTPSAVASVSAQAVGLDGQFRGVGPTPASGPRIFARALRAWVQASPSSSSARLGYLRAGASSPTSEKAAGFDGCAGGWFPVKPQGFVCAGPTATRDENDPVVRATREHPPDFARKLPYIYGTVRRPGPLYSHLPSAEELSAAEPDLEKRMEAWLDAGGEIGASYAQHVWLGRPGEPPDPAQAWSERQSDTLPAALKGGLTPQIRLLDAQLTRGAVLDQMRPKVGYSLLYTLLHAGRRYGVATDLSVVPTDRLRPIQGSDFHGVEIGKDIVFPFAFVRREDAKFYRYEGQKLNEAGAAAYRRAIKLTGKQQFFRGRLHFETADGRWLSDRDGSRLDPAKKMPGWGKAGERWLDINITKQTLVAYEGEKAVFATLVSSGEAGLEDHEQSTATKRGIFRIHTKHVSATMASDEVGEEFELRDVPYVQYFEEGYALHGAYWHDRFGTPKSHGCINLAPEDARRLFFFTQPAVPEGWHGVLKPLTGTVVFVHQ